MVNTSAAVVGRKFPAVRARNLTRKEFQLDQLFSSIGKPIFFALGFTYQSQYQINPWAKEIEKRYPGKLYSLTMAVYDTLWSKLARGWIDSSMAAGSNADEQQHTLTTTDDGFVKDKLGITNRELAHFYLIDPNGTILWTASNLPTPDALARLDKVMAGLEVL